jgi:formate-dependent nitrite reductase cytochrome c552 subunit
VARLAGRLFCLGLCLGVAACNRATHERTNAKGGRPANHSVQINVPDKLVAIQATPATSSARGERVACPTCHSLRREAPLPRSTTELDEFHSGLELRHGELVCSACHVAGDPTSLHLADGRNIPMQSVMSLCGQCHGPQLRDYRHGAHGGMRGYWDLGRGPRDRNNCVDCHDPHAPQFVGGQPVLPPRDRFLSWKAEGHEEAGMHD